MDFLPATARETEISSEELRAILRDRAYMCGATSAAKVSIILMLST
jgi:hypothetical protein